MHARSSGGVVIVLSLFFSMCLSVAPWPDQVAIWMPNWTLLTLMYWSIALPHKVSVLTGFITGLLVDILMGNLLGQNALIFSTASFFGHTLYSRLRNYRIWQQAIFILFFLLLMKLLSLWIDQLVIHTNVSYQYWLQAFSGAMLWPLIFASLRLLRRRFRVQ
ncbi:MAG: rod shape-determining protein MreD [Cycloclasticus sp.]|nr:rod shape-determining protein MreD [Cycloclasticus sp.]